MRSTVTSGRTASVLTPASGFIRAYKFTLNPYSGCGFACDYCYARFFAPSDDLRDSWGEWVRVKENAAETIGAAARTKDPRKRLEPGDSIFMSSVTDPYQPVEQKLGLTRRVLEALLPFQPRLTVQTRSPIARRDIDLFQQFRAIRVNFSVPTDSEAVRLRYEPHAPSIKARLGTAEAIRASGVPIGICVSPMLPMVDAAAFGQRFSALEAAEYVATGFHRPGRQFGAQTRVETLEKLRDDGWTRSKYERAREAIRDTLGPRRQLSDGRQGFAPAEERRDLCRRGITKAF
ncbi:MAG: radical SAM protein [Dehalococcoidia bacterium]